MRRRFPFILSCTHTPLPISKSTYGHEYNLHMNGNNGTSDFKSSTEALTQQAIGNGVNNWRNWTNKDVSNWIEKVLKERKVNDEDMKADIKQLN